MTAESETIRNLSDDFMFWAFLITFPLNNVTKLASKSTKFTAIIEMIVEINLPNFCQFS